jgi:FtsZ-interacting cell division protein ZipA
MEATTAIIIAAVVIILVGVGFWYWQRQRSIKIKRRFGPEYERTVTETGDRRKAEQILEKREKRVERFQIRPITQGDQERFTNAWRELQAQFVDDPRLAVTRADQLVADVMTVRGYPVADFEQRAADISVDHPVVVDNYRAAHAIALRHRRGEASTEDLRQAMVHYRALFEDLLGSHETVHAEVRR